MDIARLKDNAVTTRPSSFFIEDILFSKPKQLCRDYSSLANLSAIIRPSLSADYGGYHCFPAAPVFFPHVLQQVQGLAAKHTEHPFLANTAAGTILFLNLILFYLLNNTHNEMLWNKELTNFKSLKVPVLFVLRLFTNSTG